MPRHSSVDLRFNAVISLWRESWSKYHMFYHVCRTKWQSNFRNDARGGSSRKGSKLTLVSCKFRREQKWPSCFRVEEELIYECLNLESVNKTRMLFCSDEVCDRLNFFWTEVNVLWGSLLLVTNCSCCSFHFSDRQYGVWNWGLLDIYSEVSH